MQGVDPPDHLLVLRMRSRDEAALAGLYDRYAGLVFTLARRIVGDRALAEEVLQDAFLRCWTEVTQHDPARGSVAAWLMGVTRNRAIDLLRSRSHQARLRETHELSPVLGAESKGAEWFVLREIVSAGRQPGAPRPADRDPLGPRPGRAPGPRAREHRRSGDVTAGARACEPSPAARVAAAHRLGGRGHDRRIPAHLERVASAADRRHRSGRRPGRVARLPAGGIVELVGTGAPGASARLLVDADSWPAALVVTGLRPLPSGRVYQLWFARPGETPVTGGPFRVNRRGEAAVVLAAPVPLAQARAIAITEEPAPGRPAPTGKHLLDLQ